MKTSIWTTLASRTALAAMLLLPAVTSAQPDPAATTTQAAATPTSFVQARSTEIIAIINRQCAGDATCRTTRQNDLRSSITGFIDIDLMAQRTLGRHWDARSPAERTQFTALLRELIETSYSKQLGDESIGPDDYAVRYTDERTRGERSTVEGTVRVRQANHVVEIKMQTRGTGFVIYDLVTDDVSLEESYGESFDRIINEHGWDELLRRMQERIDRMRAQ